MKEISKVLYKTEIRMKVLTKDVQFDTIYVKYE